MDMIKISFKVRMRCNEDIPNGSPQTIVEKHDTRCTTQSCAEQDNNVNKGSMTRMRMRRLQHEVNLLLTDYEHASTRNYLLCNIGALLVLKFVEYIGMYG